VAFGERKRATTATINAESDADTSSLDVVGKMAGFRKGLFCAYFVPDLTFKTE